MKKLLLAGLLLAGCMLLGMATPKENKKTEEAFLANMTLEEKVGQLFMVRPEALDPTLVPAQINSVKNNGMTEWTGAFQPVLEQIPVGGIILFSKNIVNENQVTDFNKSLQEASKIPLFIGVDEEGGTVARIGGNPNFPVPRISNMESIGKTGDITQAYAAGKTIGGYLKKYGFNVDFAPVADMNTNPKNQVIGKRAFGNTPELVAPMVQAEIMGFHEEGILTAIKHYPGHGDTKDDTHAGTVVVKKTWEELLGLELLPFVTNFNTTDFVMVSHISCPNITGDHTPASLSPIMIQKKLREELGYDGLVITDSLSMGAITDHYSSGEVAVKALQAGVDVILMPHNLAEAYQAVCQAVRSGQISEKTLDEHVLRILRAKKGL